MMPPRQRSLWLILFEVLFKLEHTTQFVREDRDSAMENLILPPEDLQIITALSRKHVRSKAKPTFVDFIHGKGEGLILLLHGQLNIHASPFRVS
jgi:hypothetical protein